MNETIHTILERRSCRAYKSEQIKEEELETILECGLRAPSAVNAQDWHFSVIQNQALITRMSVDIRDNIMPEEVVKRYTGRNGGNPDFSVFYYAPTVVMISGKIENKYAPINCSLAAQNMSIAAESLGVGSIIIGMAALVPELKNGAQYVEEMQIPEGFKPIFAMCFGYKNAAPLIIEKRAGTVVRIQ